MFETPSDNMPHITECPVQAEPSPELGVPITVAEPALKASEGNCVVTTSYDYADEFNVDGAQIISMTAYFDGLAKCEAWFAARDAAFVPKNAYSEPMPLEQYFGTNEQLQWANMDRVHRGITMQPCTTAEEAVIRKFWPDGEIGTPMLPWNAI